MTVAKTDFHRVFDELIRSDDFRDGARAYDDHRDRYQRVFTYVERVLGDRGGRVLDVGAGQYAVLAKRLLPHVESDVADVEAQLTTSLAENGVGFLPVDFSREPLRVASPYDLVVMSEVIERVPMPPYLVFRNLAAALKPGGRLIVTSPNLYRIRNVVRLATGKQVFDYFRVPTAESPLGHFVEYALEQIVWQLGQAGLVVEDARLEQLSYGGSSTLERVARKLLAPVLALRPQLREDMVVVARKPGFTRAA